jgi:hypothetical protein
MAEPNPKPQVQEQTSEPQWSGNSKYSIPGVMDVAHVKGLLMNDTVYRSGRGEGSQPLSGLRFATDGTAEQLVSVSVNEDHTNIPIGLPAETVVIFVKQKRVYSVRDTYSEIILAPESWHNLLNHLHVLRRQFKYFMTTMVATVYTSLHAQPGVYMLVHNHFRQINLVHITSG